MEYQTCCRQVCSNIALLGCHLRSTFTANRSVDHGTSREQMVSAVCCKSFVEEEIFFTWPSVFHDLLYSAIQ